MHCKKNTTVKAIVMPSLSHYDVTVQLAYMNGIFGWSTRLTDIAYSNVLI